jgi:hypothetical protein
VQEAKTGRGREGCLHFCRVTPAIWLSLAVVSMLTFLSATSSVLNTPLKDQFCQHYYTGTGNCAALRSQVEAHSRTLPTLELGDRGAPPLLLLHGTYDTHATWANLFEAFCAPPHGKHFCIAPAIFDYHPDYPLVPDSSLRWYKQA